MVEVNQRVFGALVALSIVCLLSIIGSFVCWMNDNGALNENSQRDRWKWMVVVFMIVFIFMLLGVKPNVT